MTPAQKKVLDEAAKTKLKDEKVLSGGAKYINPIRKPKPKKKQSFLSKIFK